MKKRKFSNKVIYLSAAIILIAVILILYFLLFHKSGDVIPSTNPINQSPKSSGQSNNPQTGTASNNPSTGSDKNPTPQATAPSNSELIAPYGTFVSNHRPSLSGANNTPSTELSTCTTSPGASCYIKFTKDGVTKRLAAQTTDGSGSTSWHWDVSQAGLSAGTWDITAVATLNSQTKSTNDTFKLVIQP